MKLTSTPVGKSTEILASESFQAVPVVIAGTSPVKAGMPVKNDGSPAAAGTGAVGILLYDVDPNVNPNAALVVQGVINWSKCRANGASASAETMRSVLPGITFREDVGVTKTADAAV